MPSADEAQAVPDGAPVSTAQPPAPQDVQAPKPAPQRRSSARIAGNASTRLAAALEAEASGMESKKPATKPTVAPVPTKIAAIKAEPMLSTLYFTTGEVRAVESVYSPSDEPTMFSIPYGVSHVVSPAENGRPHPFGCRQNETKDGLDTRSTTLVGLGSEKATTLRKVGQIGNEDKSQNGKVEPKICGDKRGTIKDGRDDNEINGGPKAAQEIAIEECESNVIAAVPESAIEGKDWLVGSQIENLNLAFGDRKMYQPRDRVEVVVEGANGSKAWEPAVVCSSPDETEEEKEEFEGTGSILLGENAAGLGPGKKVVGTNEAMAGESGNDGKENECELVPEEKSATFLPKSSSGIQLQIEYVGSKWVRTNLHSTTSPCEGEKVSAFLCRSEPPAVAVGSGSGQWFPKVKDAVEVYDGSAWCTGEVISAAQNDVVKVTGIQVRLHDQLARVVSFDRLRPYQKWIDNEWVLSTKLPALLKFGASAIEPCNDTEIARHLRAQPNTILLRGATTEQCSPKIKALAKSDRASRKRSRSPERQPSRNKP